MPADPPTRAAHTAGSSAQSHVKLEDDSDLALVLVPPTIQMQLAVGANGNMHGWTVTAPRCSALFQRWHILALTALCSRVSSSRRVNAPPQPVLAHAVKDRCLTLFLRPAGNTGATENKGALTSPRMQFETKVRLRGYGRLQGTQQLAAGSRCLHV